MPPERFAAPAACSAATRTHTISSKTFLLCSNAGAVRWAQLSQHLIYRAVTHACLKRIRDQRNRLRLLDEHGESAPLHALRSPSPEQLVTLHRMLALMPEPLAQVAVYYHHDELSQADIARILGCSERRVSQLLDDVRSYARGEVAACDP